MNIEKPWQWVLAIIFAIICIALIVAGMIEYNNLMYDGDQRCSTAKCVIAK